MSPSQKIGVEHFTPIPVFSVSCASVFNSFIVDVGGQRPCQDNVVHLVQNEHRSAARGSLRRPFRFVSIGADPEFGLPVGA